MDYSDPIAHGPEDNAFARFLDQSNAFAADLVDSLLSRDDRLIAATPSFDEERTAAGRHIATSILRVIEREETAAGFDTEMGD